MPAKAVVYLEPAAPIRKSHAQASPSPAPAAVPFTAATVGNGSAARVETSGL